MISIVVAIYNIKQVLEYCIKSILKQDSTDWELILVNDGSTDGSEDICNAYTAVDSRIRVISKLNGGLSSARNAGLEAASGDWIMFVDGDDYLSPNTISTLQSIISIVPDQIGFIQYGYQETDNYMGENLSTLIKLQPEIISNREKMFEKLLTIGGEAASACTKLIRTHIAHTLKFKEGIIHEDEEFTTRLIFKSEAIAYIDFKPYMYVSRENSITTSRFNERRLDIIKIMNQRIKLLEDHGLFLMAEKFRGKLLRILCILYQAAYAVHNSKSYKIIATEIKSLLNETRLTNLDCARSELYKYRMIKAGIPILKTEGFARKLLKKQIRYE